MFPLVNLSSQRDEESSPDEERASRSPLWTRTWVIDGVPHIWLPTALATGFAGASEDWTGPAWAFQELQTAAVPMPELPGRWVVPESLRPVRAQVHYVNQ